MTYKVNGNDQRLRSEVTDAHFDQITAEVTAVTYGTVRPYTKELYMAVPYYTVRYGFGRIVTGYGRSLALRALAVKGPSGKTKLTMTVPVLPFTG